MAHYASGVVHNLRHNKPPFPNVWPFNLGTNTTQCEVEALGQTSFIIVHGAPFVTPTTEFNELCIILGVAPNMKNGHKIRMRQCLPMNMARMKDATTLDAKVVNISFTLQENIYIYGMLVHESTINNLPCITLSQLVSSQVVFVQILFPM